MNDSGEKAEKTGQKRKRIIESISKRRLKKTPYWPPSEMQVVSTSPADNVASVSGNSENSENSENYENSESVDSTEKAPSPDTVNDENVEDSEKGSDAVCVAAEPEVLTWSPRIDGRTGRGQNCVGCRRRHGNNEGVIWLAIPMVPNRRKIWMDSLNKKLNRDIPESYHGSRMNICQKWLPADYVRGKGRTPNPLPKWQDCLDGRGLDHQHSQQVRFNRTTSFLQKKENNFAVQKVTREAKKLAKQHERVKKLREDLKQVQAELTKAEGKLCEIDPDAKVHIEAEHEASEIFKQSLVPSYETLECNGSLSSYIYLEKLADVIQISEYTRVAMEKDGKPYRRTIPLLQIVLFILRKLRQNDSWSTLDDAMVTDANIKRRTTIERSVHAVLPYLGTALCNSKIGFSEEHVEVHTPPVCKSFTLFPYVLDDSTYVYLSQKPHHFPTNNALFDKHKDCADVRFYNCTYADGSMLNWFGPNDSQSEDYICKTFEEKSPEFATVIDKISSKVSDRGFGRTIKGQKWSNEKRLNVWTGCDAPPNGVPWTSKQVQDNKIYAALRAPVEQYHTYIRIFKLFNAFPLAEIKHAQHWYKCAVGLIMYRFESLDLVDTGPVDNDARLKIISDVRKQPVVLNHTNEMDTAHHVIFDWIQDYPKDFDDVRARPASRAQLVKGDRPSPP